MSPTGGPLPGGLGLGGSLQSPQRGLQKAGSPPSQAPRGVCTGQGCGHPRASGRQTLGTRPVPGRRALGLPGARGRSPGTCLCPGPCEGGDAHLPPGWSHTNMTSPGDPVPSQQPGFLRPCTRQNTAAACAGPSEGQPRGNTRCCPRRALPDRGGEDRPRRGGCLDDTTGRAGEVSHGPRQNLEPRREPAQRTSQDVTEQR